MNSLRNLIDFFKDAYNELKHVSWLTRKEMIASTTVVVLVVCVMTFYIFIVDVSLTKIVTGLIRF